MNGEAADRAPRAVDVPGDRAGLGVVAPEHPSYRIGGDDAVPRPAPRTSRAPVLVVLLLLLAAAIVFAGLQWRSNRALAAATAAANLEAERAADELLREQQAALEREAAKQQQARAQEEARRREVEERLRSEQVAIDASRAREQARERAWADFYRPGPGCKDSTTVQCANAYIKARRAFDKQYADAEAGAPSAPPR